MKIQVQFYAQLRDLAGTSNLNIDVRQGATVNDLIERIYELKPALRAHDRGILIGAGVDFVKRDHALREDEEIAVMPPVQGG
jgi:molybdopterin converting factor small subunit